MQANDENNSVGGEAPERHSNALLVELSAAQLQAAVEEAGLEMDALSNDVLNTARQVSLLTSETGYAGAEDKTSPTGKRNAVRQDHLADAVNSMISRLQFVDRFNQRLSNVQKNLLHIADCMRQGGDAPCEIEMAALHAQTRATLTTRNEREIFDSAISEAQRLAGGPVYQSTATKQPGAMILFDEEFKDD